MLVGINHPGGVRLPDDHPVERLLKFFRKSGAEKGDMLIRSISTKPFFFMYD
jgi:hypothetical protein|tara:strand:+ start:296 stop:451 length:156 start_codon:yes stop_codon:yes gene_type:complete